MDSQIGALRHRLVLESATRVDDGGGGVSISWTAIDTIWARINPLRGGERVEAQHIAGRLTHEITLRHRSDVVAEMRFRKDARVFHILSVIDEEERGIWLKCLCEERDL